MKVKKVSINANKENYDTGAAFSIYFHIGGFILT